MSKIFETFGKATCAIGTDEFSYHLQSKMCPFSNDGCDKAKRHTVGVCSIKTAAGNCIICPKRFYEKLTVFVEAGKLLNQGDDQIRWIKEVSLGDSFVDFILFSSKKEKAIDFLGLEIQALDTSGSMWMEIEKVLISKGICQAHSLKPFKCVTINWKTTAKTTIMQIIEKAPYFENENKYLVLAIQKPFFDYLSNHYECKKWSHNSKDTIQIHIYDYDDGNRIEVVKKVSTNLISFREMLLFDIKTKKTNLLTRINSMLLKQKM